MKIGLTYDLRDDYLAAGYGEEETAEFDRQDTIEAIEGTLRSLGYQTDRIGHIRQLAERLVDGDRWELVFNIAEGMYGYGREAQVPALLDAYRIPYTFSDPLVLALTLHKGMTKQVVRTLGIPTPDFALVETVSDLERLDLPFPLFAKPVAEGTSKGISAASKARTRAELEAVCRDLLRRYHQPVLVEVFLPGQEFTIGMVGTGSKARAVGAMEVTLVDQAEPEVYSYTNKAKYKERVCYRLVDGRTVDRAIDIALRAWRGLGCRDGGRVDLRCDADGIPQFLEVNPLAGLHPEHSDLPILCNLQGIAYSQLLEMIMESALERIVSVAAASVRDFP
ncbi:MAG: D-alanine--D-alanine ligase [Candidatus Glassbacteria bacterium RBG_16_58_8]|uniref:D-alanine--D-alanine ligase n=1 Tax=Candidatus Glassbacteria bacterium RBG_16_58_8 TaxID=1817866 RepID=A0A1F5YAP4_9BACT|nr:MAG: D-alanine--D-alanine ligase [Candidatus Glassbacteria bacterium RBG_16_58_8]